MYYKKVVFRSLAMITQIGISMLAPIILCVFAGYWLDRKFGWNTTIVLLILGILAGGRNCYMLLKDMVNAGGKKKDD